MNQKPSGVQILKSVPQVLTSDRWQTSSRYMMVEAFAQIDKEEIDPILSITAKAA